MNLDVFQAQLVAMRTQIDAMILQISAEQGTSNECPHPPSQRQDLSVIGGPERWVCGLCGHEHVGSDD